jgi:DNA invertase Pin-like site-specific DNA recombinase
MLRIGYICDTALFNGNGNSEMAQTSAQIEADRTALLEAGCKVIRVETAHAPHATSGVVFQAVIDFAEKGDEIVVARLNQIAGSSVEALATLKSIKSRGIGLRLLDPGLNREGLVDDDFIRILELICSLDTRLPNRVFLPIGMGRRIRVTTDEIKSLQARGLSAAQIAEQLRVSRMTIWRKLKQA